jgi:hypothetical protein
MSNILNNTATLPSKKLTQMFLIAFLYTSLSGMLRKWVFLSSVVGNIVFLGQLILPFLFAIVTPWAFKNIFNHKAFMAFFFLLVVQAFNPMNLTIYHG